NAVLPAGAVVVDETITHRMEILNELDRLGPGGFFCGCIGGLGTGLGTALGVKAAHPDKTVIATIGDGSFNYNPVLAALGFAQEYGMPIMIVMFDNQGYLSQQAGVPKYFPGGFAMKAQKYAGTSIKPTPEYAGLAPLFGGYGERVDEPGELRAALQRGLKAVKEGKLALLDVRLAPVP
ncbi:MAG: thiamine pyrophosphate-dependent enzyme, partial [Sulfuricaulis sp.]|nr:thiamine pyrophosphate-dependent enzyme [Sulfuricaulis sp.]